MRRASPEFVGEYSTPEVYDSEYGTFETDGPFFESLISNSEMNLLDLGCGTGRLTLPLSALIHQAYGIDLSEEMLTLAKAKDKLSRVQWTHGDCRDFNLPQRFDLIIMGGNAFQAMLTDQDILIRE